MNIKRIVLTGGGSGGHIFPLLAVADELKKVPYELEVYYVGPKNSLQSEFLERDIPVHTILGSKLRRYASIGNILDVPKFFISIIQALVRLYALMPDLVFSKGGTGAFPVVFAAWFYRIPVVIHESDAAPGITNRLSAKFSKRICISFQGVADYFPTKKIVFTGNPIREELIYASREQVTEGKLSLGLKEEMPLLFILGGSQGSVRINRFVLDNLDKLLREFQVYHQVGSANIGESELLADSMIQQLDSETKHRYRMAGFLSLHEMKKAYAAADIVISRSGASDIFEIAAFGKPSILIPLAESGNDHQRLNAYEYAKRGAAVVIEESNLSLHVAESQIMNILGNKNICAAMSAAAKAFSTPDAAKMIVGELLNVLGFTSMASRK